MLVKLHRVTRRGDQSIVVELRFPEEIYDELLSRSAVLPLLPLLAAFWWFAVGSVPLYTKYHGRFKTNYS